MNNLCKVVIQFCPSWNSTLNLMIASPMPYHYAITLLYSRVGWLLNVPLNTLQVISGTIKPVSRTIHVAKMIHDVNTKHHSLSQTLQLRISHNTTTNCLFSTYTAHTAENAASCFKMTPLWSLVT